MELIENRQSELTAKINESNAARQELIAQYQNGEISREAFVAAMRGLAAEVSATAKSMGTLGQQMAAIGTGLAANLRQRAEELVTANKNMAISMAQAGQAIGEQMRNQGYGPPEGLPIGPPESLPGFLENLFEGIPGGPTVGPPENLPGFLENLFEGIPRGPVGGAPENLPGGPPTGLPIGG